jgi:hypothetical protein
MTMERPFIRCWQIYPRRLSNTAINHENLGVNMSLKKHVLLSVENKQGVELYTGDLVVGPQNGFAVVPGTVKPLALKAVPITPAMMKQSKKRAKAPQKKPH